jgi:act minimal PKS chain-length factor (CLF/KS beta)
MNERIVITGAGVVAPNGCGNSEFWDATLRGASGVRRLSRFDPTQYPTTVGGEILDFDESGLVPGRLLPQTDRTTRFALAAAQWALEEAKVELTEFSPYDVGVITANGCGGFEFGQRELQKLWSEGPHRVSAYQSFAWFYAVNTGQLSIRHGLKGHSSVLVSEQAGGLDALAAARRRLRDGSLRLALTGGVDAPLGPWGLTAQIPNGRLSAHDDPSKAYLPFDTNANGYVAGEGGAMFVLEELEAARERGTGPIHGEIAGYAATFDPPLASGREPALSRAIEGALADAGLDEVDVVVADASGVPELDAQEAAAITRIFGSRAVPVAVPKAATGRLYSGAGPLDVFCGLKMIADNVVPAAVNLRRIPDEYELDVVVGEPRRQSVSSVLVIARGYGGFNSAVVLRAV